MDRKLRDYFLADVRLVWYIDPKTRTARAYTAEQVWTDVGPERFARRRRCVARLQLPLAQLFARVDGPLQE